MELEEILEISVLFNYYKNLLSGKQKEYLADYLEDDLSLSEIAKNHEVTRQAVYDNIRRGIKLLYEYEEKIGFYKKECEIETELENLKKDMKIENIDKIIEKMF
ncbi:MAG: YlxM family DNA-binding protein [Fusobacteriaceae bacterium]